MSVAGLYIVVMLCPPCDTTGICAKPTLFSPRCLRNSPAALRTSVFARENRPFSGKIVSLAEAFYRILGYADSICNFRISKTALPESLYLILLVIRHHKKTTSRLVALGGGKKGRFR